MSRYAVLLFVLFAFTLSPSPDVAAETPVAMPGLPVVTAVEPADPPAWAVMQRQLIDDLNEAAREYVARFVYPGGEIRATGPWDDVYEMFFNWPLFYAIGGDPWIMETALTEYNAITRQFSRPDPAYPESFIDDGDWYQIQDPQLSREFPVSDDWFHNSEGMTLFYGLGLGAPDLPENIARARRFADMYTGDDPEAPNYDPEHRIIRGVLNGSVGPRFEVKKSALPYLLDPQYSWVSLSPAISEIEPGWQDSKRQFARLERTYNDIVLHGDHPLNLMAVGLVTNAYLYTGDTRYREWIENYTGAWMDRIETAGGVIPDNTDLRGRPGGSRDGQWWGGFFGWTGRYSLHMIPGSCSVAAECAQLVTGDDTYLDLLRSQLTLLMDKGRTTAEGQLLVPFNYGQEGWTSYRPMPIRDLAHLWHASMRDDDRALIERVRAGSKFAPLGYSRLYHRRDWEAQEPFDWTYEASVGDRHDNAIAEFPRIAHYITGDNPDWALSILQADWRSSRARLERIRRADRPTEQIFGDALYQYNPVITKGLEQTTMGCPQAIYNGGLLRARVRYFDRDRGRPGLPPDVAALVEEITADRTVVRLVNVGLDSRSLIVQAGAFGEHRFTDLRAGDVTMTVDRRHLGVDLPPRTSILLELGTDRFVNTPSYSFPWQ
jgi:hypothetical protein